MIVLLGATGHTGSETARLLHAQGVPVRAVTRDPARAATLPALAGVPIVAGDTSQPGSLTTAFDGATGVFLVPPTEPGWDVLQAEIVALAAAAGVQHMVKLSAMGAGPDEPSMSLAYHWKGEQDIEASGMTFTHVRPNSFFQNTFFDVATLQSEGKFYSCVGPAKFAKIDTRDIAAVVATVLTEDGHAGHTYELTGAEPLGYADIADHLAAALGTSVDYVDLPGPNYSAALCSAGIADWLADEFVDIYGKGFYGDGKGARVTDTVARLLGRPPRTFAAFAAENVEAFRRSTG